LGGLLPGLKTREASNNSVGVDEKVLACGKCQGSKSSALMKD